VVPSAQKTTEHLKSSRSVVLGVGLLGNIVLSAPLLSLAHIVLLLIISLSLLIASNTRNSSANSTRNSVADATNVVVNLALSLLLLTFLVLVATRSLDGLRRKTLLANAIIRTINRV
jgi:hypothetical protein